MRVTCIADTHGRHDELILPGGDLLIHAGDIGLEDWGTGEVKYLNFINWMLDQNYKYRFFIAGNHDFYLEKAPSFVGEHSIYPGRMKYMYDETATYFNRSSNNIKPINLYGSPYQPEFRNWAFNLPRGEALAYKWSLIPEDVNILITHGPPHDILDTNKYGSNIGCKDLRKRIKDLKDLKLHVFGHIHESAGKLEQDGVIYVNASVVDLKHEIQLPNGITVEIPD